MNLKEYSIPISSVCACVCALVRKSKAADQRRRSLAKQTREDDRRRSLKALERGRVAAMTKAFGGEKPTPPPKPKPRNLTLANEPLNRSVHITVLFVAQNQTNHDLQY